MEAIKNGLRKNLTPAQLWSGARFFLLLNLGLIIYAEALNFYCAPNRQYHWQCDLQSLLVFEEIAIHVLH